MASQSIPNIVVKNHEIKDKLNDKIQANYNELALLSKHLIKSSRSNEVTSCVSNRLSDILYVYDSHFYNF